jgi:hypothetical protein
LNSDKYKVLQEGGSNLVGIYTKYESSKTHLRDMLTEGYQKTGKLSLYGQVFNTDGTDTKKILRDLAPSGWNWVYNNLLNFATLGLLGLPCIIGLTLYTVNGNKKENNVLTRLSLGNCSTLDTWTNTSGMSDGEARVHYIHGTV